MEFGNITVDLGRGGAMLRRDELLPRETFRTGDRVRALILDVREEQRDPQIFSRAPIPISWRSCSPRKLPEDL